MAIQQDERLHDVLEAMNDFTAKEAARKVAEKKALRWLPIFAGVCIAFAIAVVFMIKSREEGVGRLPADGEKVVIMKDGAARTFIVGKDVTYNKDGSYTLLKK